MFRVPPAVSTLPAPRRPIPANRFLSWPIALAAVVSPIVFAAEPSGSPAVTAQPTGITQLAPPAHKLEPIPAEDGTAKKSVPRRVGKAGAASARPTEPTADTPEGGNPFERPHALEPAGQIDELVFARLEALGIEPAHVCSDAVFARRMYLDVTGTLPTAAEARRFLQDRDPDKRAALIDELLRRGEFVDYWTTRWCDILRVKAEFPINLWPNAAQSYHRWIHTAVRDNLPYDRFARALLTSSGSNFRDGAVNFYRAAPSHDPQGIARTVMLTFMGTHADTWPADRVAGLAAFFSAVGYKPTQEWKEEIVFFDGAKLDAKPLTAVLPDGTRVALTADRDPREVFAEWLTRPDNPWFARTLVNRVWAWLLGRGIVEPADDARPDNPPSNPELLAWLEQRFVASGYDVRTLLRLILQSQTYQLSSLRRSDDPAAEANFAFYAPRRLDAEVLIDALNQITGTTESYSSAIPEPFTFIPENQRSIALPDGSITSAFLEMFGRPSRDTGEQNERNNRVTATQRLHLLNSTHVQHKIERGPRLQALLRSRRPPPEIVGELYFTILSRPPTAAERAAVAEYAAATNGRTAAIDVAWALINSAEFLYQH